MSTRPPKPQGYIYAQRCAEPPPPPYTAVATDNNPAPLSPPPLFPPPGTPRRNSKRKKKRPAALQMRLDPPQPLSLVQQRRDRTQKLPTTPITVLPVDGMRASDSGASSDETSGRRNNRSPSPTLSDIIDEICDSPTLGLEECFDQPIKIEPFTPTTERFPGSVSQTPEITPRAAEDGQSTRPGTASSIASSSIYYGLGIMEKAILPPPIPPIHYRAPLSPLPPIPPVPLSPVKSAYPIPPLRRKSVFRAYDERAPSINESLVDDRNWNVEFSIEYGVRPGEREVMPESFSRMKMKASDSCSVNSHWEDCIIRVFENQNNGTYRIFTLRGKKIDQRLVPLAAAEMVPEYGYHNNFPVIFLRKAGPGTFSLSMPSKEKAKSSRKSSISSGTTPTPAPASLYYKFNSLIDMFTFQTAFLQETVEADFQYLTSVRYTRGFLSSPVIAPRARLQLWKPLATELTGASSSSDHRNSLLGTSGRGTRAPALTAASRIKPARLVFFLETTVIVIFITDDLVASIPVGSPRTIRVRPSSHKAFNNPSHVRAAVLGDAKRELKGGFRLDRDGLGCEAVDGWDEFKWFEIEFSSEEEAGAFSEDFLAALQQRRRERVLVDELRRKAGRGVRAGEW